MQEAITFVDRARLVARTIGESLVALEAMPEVFRPPTEEALRAFEERFQRMQAEQRAYEAERLRRNPNLRYRSRQPLWWRLKYPRRGHQRPASLLHEVPDWRDY